MKDNKKTYAVAAFSKISIIIISMVTSALVNRQLGVVMKGQYSYIINMVSMLIIFFCLGLGQTYSTYRRKYGEQILGYFLSLTIIQTILSFAIGIIFAMLKNYNMAIAFILTSSGVLKTNILYYAAIEDVKKRDINNIIYKLIYLIIIIIYYIFLPSSINILLIIALLEDILIIVCTFKSYNFKFKFRNIFKINLKEIYKLGFLCMIMHSLMTLNYNLDIFFLKKMTSLKYVGLYSVGVTLANMLWLIPDAFKDVLVNKTSRSDPVKEIILVTKYSFYFSIILIIGFAILGEKFIVVMYGKEFVNSYFCTIILFIGCLSMIIYKLIHPIYIAKGKQIVVVIILCISVITNIIANILLIPKYNIYGAAWSSVLSYSLCSIIFLIIFCKDYNVNCSEFFIIRGEEIKKVMKDVRTKLGH